MSCLRSSRFTNLPLALRGSCSSRNHTWAGILCLAMRVDRNDCSCVGVHRRAVAQHDGRGHLFAQSFVGHAEHRRLGDVVVLVDGRLDLAAVHVLAAAQHHVLGAVDDVHEAVLVDAGDVAGVEPPVTDRVGGGLGPVQVALDHHGTAHAQLADGGGGPLEVVALVVDELRRRGWGRRGRTTRAWR